MIVQEISGSLWLLLERIVAKNVMEITQRCMQQLLFSKCILL